MTTGPHFTVEEERRISADARARRAASCPRCGVALDRRPVPPRRDVSYVRDRILLVCPSCHRAALVDVRGGA